MYQMMEERGVPTHLVADVDEVNLLVKRVDILMVEGYEEVLARLEKARG